MVTTIAMHRENGFSRTAGRHFPFDFTHRLSSALRVIDPSQ